MAYRRRRGFSVFDLPPIRRFTEEHKRLTLIILALFLAIFGVRGFLRYQEKKAIVESCTAQAQGVIVDRRTNTHFLSNRRTTYTGIVEFEVGGQSYTAHTASSRTMQHLGTSVTVYYDPADPSRNCTDTGNEYSAVGIGIAVGLIALIGIIVAVDVYRKKNGGSFGAGQHAPENTYEQPKYDDIFK